MNDLYTWAADWGIPAAAIPDLMQRLGVVTTAARASGSEAKVQSEARLAAAGAGLVLWRNNVGALMDARGVPVRYGLANDSAALNARVKSADLIGIRRVTGQFVSRECKREGWAWSGTPREEAQLRWALIVQEAGGDARFITSGAQV